jgi:nicotinamidase/pyrazinamidase
VHCVQNTKGAELHPDLNVDKIDQILLKGTGNRDDGYSNFEATNISLEEFLKEKGVNEIYVTGLATDYCVKATAIEASEKGFNTYVITDAIKAVNAQPEDNTRALKEMKKAGCNLITSKEIFSKTNGII